MLSSLLRVPRLEGHHRAVVDQDLAVAIEDLAARWVNPDVEDAVVIGEGAVVLTVEDLQGPEPEEDRRDRDDDDRAQNRDTQV